MDQSSDVFGKTGSTVAYHWEKELGTDPAVGAYAHSDIVDGGADDVAQVGNFIHEGYFRGHEGIRGVSGQFRGFCVHHDSR